MISFLLRVYKLESLSLQTGNTRSRETVYEIAFLLSNCTVSSVRINTGEKTFPLFQFAQVFANSLVLFRLVRTAAVVSRLSKSLTTPPVKNVLGPRSNFEMGGGGGGGALLVTRYWGAQDTISY